MSRKRRFRLKTNPVPERINVMTAVDQTPPFNSIMLPIDHEEIFPALVKFAARATRLYETSLTLLFVLELPGHSSGAGFASESSDESANRIQKLVDEQIRPLLEGATIDQVIIRSGRPAEIICSVAKDLEIDVVIMGSTGETGLAHMLTGSVTEKVVHRCSRPVMTYPIR
jgi:nucleotide-binding universal stress UspA family protein